MRIGRTALSGLAIVALLGGIWVGQLLMKRAGPDTGIPGIQGAIYQAPRVIPPFELSDQSGSPFTQEDFGGHWTLVYFGYTYCPDVCPTTLAALGRARTLLTESDKTEDTAYVFISVDPGRDTPARLAEYTPHFSDGLLGVTGDPAQLMNLSRALGVVYVRVGDDPEDYLMDHSSVVLVVNPAGQLQAVLTAPHTVEQLVDDFTRVRNHYEG